MQRFFITYIVLVISFTAQGQLIDNMKGAAFNTEMFFNETFLKINRIESITVSYAMKRTGRPIENKPDIKIYSFNEQGQLIKIDAVTSVLSRIDSTHIAIDRNELGLVSQRTEASKRGFTSVFFEYDSKGNVIKTENKTSENESDEKLKLVPGFQYAINTETYQYAEPDANTLQKQSFNNYGLPFATTRIIRDPSGYILREENEQTIGGKSNHILYSYNDHGWISEKKTVNPQKPELPIRQEYFEYDKLGNLTGFKVHSNGKLVRDLEIIYTPTFFIDAVLDQDMSTKDILISRYSFQFRKP